MIKNLSAFQKAQETISHKMTIMVLLLTNLQIQVVKHPVLLVLSSTTVTGQGTASVVQKWLD